MTVVIPTTSSDPVALDRAVRSAVNQSRPPAEVIVVVDRPETTLPTWPIPVRAIHNTGMPGPSGARNSGIRAASHAFIALLDDDDYWHPSKLAAQLATVESLPPERQTKFVGAARGWLLEAGGARICPEALPAVDERLVDYLFAPSIIRRPARRILTPSIMVSASLAKAHPFDETLHRWEDNEWLLRLVDVGAEFVYCPELLLTVDTGRPRDVGHSHQPAAAEVNAAWAEMFLKPRSDPAFNNFRLTHVTRSLVDEGRRAEALHLGWHILWTGTWHIQSLYEHVLFVAMSPRQRAALRALRGRLRRRGTRREAAKQR